MAEVEARRLSELVDAPSSRRTFLARASALSLAVPGVGAALAACAPGGGGAVDTARGRSGPGAPGARAPNRARNSDSKLDSAVLKDRAHGATSATPGAVQGTSAATFRRYHPALPPLPEDGKIELHWHAREVPSRISDDTVRRSQLRPRAERRDRISRRGTVTRSGE